MPIQNPTQLVEEFKNSGEFDRLRRELLEEFRNGDDLETFVDRVDGIVRKKLHYDSKLLFGPEPTAQRELLQELDRYPIVERAVSDLPTLQDPAFTSGLRESLSRVLQESRSRDAAEDDDVDMAPDATGRPNLTPLQTRPLGQDGSGTPGDQDGLKTRSVHFDAQEDNDSDSDSAMLESPISDRDTSEPAAQFSQDSIQGSHDSMPPSSPMVQLTDEPALQPPESPAMQASEELYIQDTLEPMVEDAAQPMVQADDEVAEAQASEEVVVQTNEETSMPPPAPPEHDGILAS